MNARLTSPSFIYHFKLPRILPKTYKDRKYNECDYR